MDIAEIRPAPPPSTGLISAVSFTHTVVCVSIALQYVYMAITSKSTRIHEDLNAVHTFQGRTTPKN